MVMSDRSRLYLVTSLSVLGAGAVLATSSLPSRLREPGWALALVLVILVAHWVENQSASLGRAGTFSSVPLLLYTVAISLGPWAVVPIAAVWLGTARTWPRRIFNTCQYIFFTGAGARMYWFVHARFGNQPLQAVIPHAVAIVTMVVLNLSCVTLLRLAVGEGPVSILWNAFYWPIIPTYVDNLLYGVLCVQVTHWVGFEGLLFAAFVSFSKLQTQRQVVGNAIGSQLSAEALLEVVEARDRYTRKHCERVAYYAKGIATAMDLPPLVRADIEMAAHLHDIGKIAVPDSILMKEGPLDEQEFDRIKEHPVRGAQILSANAQLDRIAKIVVQHHERLDGKGYPRGVKGEWICIEARVIACADAFDAMTTDRPYRPALTIDQAVIELHKNSGTQFDPRVVQGMLRFLTDKRDREAVRAVATTTR